jgi:hypothetical protein
MSIAEQLGTVSRPKKGPLRLMVCGALEGVLVI